MKKEKNIEDVPKTSEKPASNVRVFFTKEINDQISEMGTKEMETTLKQMVDSRQFIAILKYNLMRSPLLDAALRSTDPIKEPSKISWSQGALAGLSDLESYIIELNASKPEQETEDGNTNYNPEGVV